MAPQGHVFAEDAAHDAVSAVELLGDLPDAPSLVVKACSVQFPAPFLLAGARLRTQEATDVLEAVSTVATGRAKGHELSLTGPAGDGRRAHTEKRGDLPRPEEIVVRGTRGRDAHGRPIWLKR